MRQQKPSKEEIDKLKASVGLMCRAATSEAEKNLWDDIKRKVETLDSKAAALREYTPTLEIRALYHEIVKDITLMQTTQ